MATSIEELAKKFGGAPVTSYEELAKKFGGSVVTDQEPAPTAQRRPAFLEGTEDIPRMLPRQRAVVSEQVQAEARAQREKEEAEKLAFNQVAEDPVLFKTAERYLVASGKPGKQEDETNEDVVKRFMSERRFAEYSTVLGTVPELSRLANAEPEAKRDIAEGKRLYKAIADAGTAKGQQGLRPALDIFKALVPELVVGAATGGVGSIGGKAAVTTLAAPLVEKAIIKQVGEKGIQRAGLAGIGVAEAGLGAAIDVTGQRSTQEEAKALGEEPPELDTGRTAAISLFSAALGVGGTMLAGPRKVYQQGEELKKALAKTKDPVVPSNPNAPQTPVEKALVDPLRDNMDKVHDEYMKLYGKELLTTIDPTNEITDSKVRLDMSKAAIRLALKAINDDPTFKLKPNEQISSAIANVFKNLGKIDDVVLERALTESGITPAMFAAMNKTSVSEAAKIMQQNSAAMQALTRLRKTDKEFDKKIKTIYSLPNDQVTVFSKAYDLQDRLASEYKAFLVSGVDTTARNSLSMAVVMPLKSGVQLVEGTLYSINSALLGASSGKRLETFKRSMGDTIHDVFDVYYYMMKSGLTRDLLDDILKTNPTLRNNINNALQETGERKVSVVAQWANSVNVVMDSFVRRSVYVASVDSQLRRQGKNLMKDFAGQDKEIPVPIIKQASKDALQMTFSYKPNPNDPNLIASTDKVGAQLGRFLVDAIEKTPVLNTAIPFPRYMANAMAYYYRYSPFGALGAGEEFITSFRMMKEAEKTGSKETLQQAEKIFRSASEKGIQSVVGMATLAAFIDYRRENLDLPWYEQKLANGTSIDARSYGITAPYMAIADLFVKFENGTYSGENVQAAIESTLGFKMSAGSPDSFINKILSVFESPTAFRDFMVTSGKAVGDVAKGFTQPFVFKQIYDLTNLIREEGRVVRDPNVIESEEIGPAVVEAATKRVMGTLPVLKEKLPEAVVPLTEDELSREGEYFARLVGFRQVPRRSELEREINRLNLMPYSVYGRPSGDREYDRQFIRNANTLVLERVPSVLQDRQYLSLSELGKKIRLTNEIRAQTALAKELTNEQFSRTDLSKVFKMKFNNLPKATRREINNLYAKDNNGVTLEEAKDWFSVDKYETIFDAMVAPKTSLGEQSRMLFGR
jgi:hypothetical protein